MEWKLKILTCLYAAFAVVSSTYEGTVYVNEGEQLTVPCKNDTPGAFYGIVWKTRVELYTLLETIGYKVHPKVFRRSRLVEDTSLQIDNTRLDDAGIYECNLIFVRNPGELPRVMMGSRVDVVVFVKPNITSLKPQVQHHSIGDVAVLTCSFHGIPYANVTWRYDGSKDLSSRYTTVKNTSVLTLRRLRKKDTGFYSCVAFNRAGRVEEKAFIKVKYPPKVTYITPNPHIDVDKSGTILCKARGYPIPMVFWLLNTGKKRIDLSAGEVHQEKFAVSSPKMIAAEETVESLLTINSVTVDDWKINITCVASNDQGSKEKVVNVKGFDKPRSPELTRFQMFTNNVVLHWSVPKDGGSKILAYVLQYKNASEGEWMSREIRPANVQSFQIMGLEPNTMYSFRIAARNEVGISKYSDVLRTATEKEIDRNPFDNFGTTIPKIKNQKTDKNKDEISGNFGITALVGIIAGVFLILIVVCIAVFCLFRKVQKTTNSQTASVLGSRPVSIENGSLAPPESRRPSEMPSDTGEFIPLLTRVDHWEFPRDRLRLSTVLGSGAFGTVMRGDARGIKGSSGSVKVAVKIAKDEGNVFARKDLHAELDVLKLLPEHPNVVGLLGCCTRNEPLMIIVEYCAHGDLQGFLRNSRGISESYYKATYHPNGQKMTSNMLLTFALHVAKGMSHLSAFKVIHRDLAARNILVDENLVCKISDFGFARDVYVEDQYMKKSKGGRFPIKWMAIESLLDGISTSKSDVWAFGVVLWEIVTLGASPYPGMNSYEVVSFLQDGYRMDKPKHCTDELYALCMNCWHVTPQRRPTFDELADMLKQMVDDEKEYINMNFYQVHLYENFDVNLACHSSANASAAESSASEITPLAANTMNTTVETTT